MDAPTTIGAIDPDLPGIESPAVTFELAWPMTQAEVDGFRHFVETMARQAKSGRCRLNLTASACSRERTYEHGHKRP